MQLESNVRVPMANQEFSKGEGQISELVVINVNVEAVYLVDDNGNQ